MLIRDLSYFENLNRSLDVAGGQQPDDGVLVLSLTEDNNLSVKQGNTELLNKKLTTPVQGIKLSIPSNPNIAISSATLVTGGKPRTTLTLSFSTSGLPFSPTYGLGLTPLMG